MSLHARATDHASSARQPQLRQSWGYGRDTRTRYSTPVDRRLMQADTPLAPFSTSASRTLRDLRSSTPSAMPPVRPEKTLQRSHGGARMKATASGATSWRIEPTAYQPYIEPGEHGRRFVAVLPRSAQVLCRHDWRDRPIAMVSSDRTKICKDCGATLWEPS